MVFHDNLIAQRGDDFEGPLEPRRARWAGGFTMHMSGGERSKPGPVALFTSDLHGRRERYSKLLSAIERRRPDMVLLGGDLLRSGIASVASRVSFLDEFLAPAIRGLHERMGAEAPDILVIPGNDDGRLEEGGFLRLEGEGLLRYMACRRDEVRGWIVYGYPFIPPSPFRLKDWERYDVSRYVDPGCIPPEEGLLSGTVELGSRLRYPTIQDDLATWTGAHDVSRSIFLFHCPPHRCGLDRAALDGKMVDHCPVDVHIGSIAIRRFIEERQPWLTLHGHVHESARITGSWRERFGRTWALSGAHDGPELSLVTIPLNEPAAATRELL